MKKKQDGPSDRGRIYRFISKEAHVGDEEKTMAIAALNHPSQPSSFSHVFATAVCLSRRPWQHEPQ